MCVRAFFLCFYFTLSCAPFSLFISQLHSVRTFQFRNWTYLPPNTNKNWLCLANLSNQKCDERNPLSQYTQTDTHNNIAAQETNEERWRLRYRIERARVLLMIAQEQCRLFGTWYKSISRNVIRFAREQETEDLKPIIQSSRRIHLLCHQNICT